MEFRQLTNQEFNNFVENFKLKSIYQTPEYGFVMNEQNYDAILLGMINNSVVVAATMILIRKESGFKYAYAPRGFLLDYNDFYLLKDFTNNIKNYLSKKGIIGIKINPLIIKNIYDFHNQTIIKNEKYDLIFEALKHNGYYHLGYNNFFEALKPRFEAIIDLKQSPSILFKNVKKEYRTKIRSAVKNGIRVYKGDFKELENLYGFTKDKYIRDLNYFKDCYGFYTKREMVDLYYTKLDTKTYLEVTQKRLSFYEQQSNFLNNKIIKMSSKNPKKTIDKKMNMDKYLNQYRNELLNATRLLREYPDGIITSVVLTIKQGKEITILIDGYDLNYKRLNSKHLLIWQLIEIYQRLGYERLNLGGLSNMTVDSNKYVGLNEFKLNFGAKIYEYAGDFELIAHKYNYNLYRNYVPLKNLIKSKIVK